MFLRLLLMCLMCLSALPGGYLEPAEPDSFNHAVEKVHSHSFISNERSPQNKANTGGKAFNTWASRSGKPSTRPPSHAAVFKERLLQRKLAQKWTKKAQQEEENVRSHKGAKETLKSAAKAVNIMPDIGADLKPQVTGMVSHNIMKEVSKSTGLRSPYDVGYGDYGRSYGSYNDLSYGDRPDDSKEHDDDRKIDKAMDDVKDDFKLSFDDFTFDFDEPGNATSTKDGTNSGADLDSLLKSLNEDFNSEKPTTTEHSLEPAKKKDKTDKETKKE